MSESLTVEQLWQLCDAAIQAAEAAGQFIQSVDRSTLQRHFKEAGSSEASQIVTEVDVRSEAIIRERLLDVSEQWDIAFVGEESSQRPTGSSKDRFLKPYFWCVDPLDGTLPFVEGRPGYAVSIALVERSGTPLIGVVYDPADSTLIHAVKGQGAYRDRSALQSKHLESSSTISALTVFADSSFKTHEKFDATIDILNGCAQNVELHGISLIFGSGAVKNACQVMVHSAACYLKLPKAQEGGGSIWDFAATACIAAEAGAWASNIYGEPLELNRKSSTFMSHQGVIYASSKHIASYLIDAL